MAYRAIEDGLKIYSSKSHELFLLIDVVLVFLWINQSYSSAYTPHFLWSVAFIIWLYVIN